MSSSRATIALYLGLVFASGAVLGVFGERYYYAASNAAQNNSAKNKGKRTPSPEEFRKMYLSGMKKELLLSDEQVAKLSNVMDETRSLLDEMHKRHRPEQQEIQRSQNEKIRALFDNLQREKYDDMMKRLAERNKTKNKGRSGGGF
jgi:Spy/CpxP family protein refolding chaperone